MANYKSFDKYLSRRMMGDTGWMYFCRQCGMYRPEEEFKKVKNTYWGLSPSCRLHNKTSSGKLEKDTEYLVFRNISEQNFIETQKVMEALGFNYGQGKTVHQQFCEKHNLNC